ncbi:MAG: hypothetical protein CMJ81_15035 [Planctomycetaceae bacterium]|nr:hypothetical protein [Planctomycetaceae bacterium]MBP61807.1 hypothetical protein [Planctomycetaceae bacterium]
MAIRGTAQIACVVSTIGAIREMRLALLWIDETDTTNLATIDQPTKSAVSTFGVSRWFAESAYREH